MKYKRHIKKSPIGDFIFNRKVQAYGVGLERTGTTYLANLFSEYYRSAHEPDKWSLFNFLSSDEEYLTPNVQLKEWVLQRDRTLRLEFEASHALSPMIKVLMQTFPMSKFILTIRNPTQWVKSVMQWEINHNFILEKDNHWRPVLDNYYGAPVRAEDGFLIYPIEGYLNKWKRHHEFILENIPARRLLVLETEKLSISIPEIAGFLKIPKETLCGVSAPKNANPKTKDLLANIDFAPLKSKTAQHCHQLFERLLAQKV